MKFISILSVFMSLSAFASFSNDICEELYNQGDMRGYEDCVSSISTKPLSVPRNLCERFGYNTPAYESCMNGEFDSPKTIPHSICLKFLPHNPIAYSSCMKGEYDQPLF